MTQEERRNSGSEWAKSLRMLWNDASSAWILIDILDECRNYLKTAALFDDPDANSILQKMDEIAPRPDRIAEETNRKIKG